MLKLAKFIYAMGRKQAYSEVIAKLEGLSVNLPRTREGFILKEPIDTTIKEIKLALGDEEGKTNVKTNA